MPDDVDEGVTDGRVMRQRWGSDETTVGQMASFLYGCACAAALGLFVGSVTAKCPDG